MKFIPKNLVSMCTLSIYCYTFRYLWQNSITCANMCVLSAYTQLILVLIIK